MIFKTILNYIKVIADNNKNNNLTKEIKEKKSQLSKINNELDKIHINASNIYQDASKLMSNFQNDIEPFSFNYTKTHLIRYQILNKKRKLHLTKNIVILLLFIYLFIVQPFLSKGIFSNFNFSSVQAPFNYKLISYSELICPIIVAYIITLITSFILHIVIYKKSSIKPNPVDPLKKIEQKKGFKYIIKCIFYFVLSPDLFFANYYKNKIKKNIFQHIDYQEYDTYTDKNNITPNQWNAIKIEFKSYIQACNWTNVIISIILFAAPCIIIIECLKVSNDVIQLFLCIIVFRILSRGIEVSVAFYKDIVRTDAKLFFNETIPNRNAKYINGFKSSLLRQNSRLSLAIHTLLEFFILYASAYYLLFNLLSSINSNFFCFDSTLCDTTVVIQKPNFSEMLLFSSTLGIFNISYGVYQNIFLGILHFSQVILSAILILISIAQYVSGDSSLTKEDEALYRNAALDENNLVSIDELYSDSNSYLK